jgi:hypothetical protein
MASLTDSDSVRATTPFENVYIGPCLDDEVEPALRLFLSRHKLPVKLYKSSVRMRAE